MGTKIKKLEQYAIELKKFDSNLDLELLKKVLANKCFFFIINKNT